LYVKATEIHRLHGLMKGLMILVGVIPSSDRRVILMEKIKYYSGIKRYITSRIGNPDDAEDLAQRVVLEFYQNNDETDALQNPEAYLFGIARKLIGRYYCQKDKQPVSLEEVDSEVTDKICYDNYNKDFKARVLAEEIYSIISKLPPKAREAVELRLIDGLDPKEAAQKAKCSVEIFYKRFHEGLKILRKKLKT
jgi:RNA polymerase sigma factor (sigma-70 family)